MTTADIFVKTNFVALHRWATAKGRRAYLAHPHRHIFHIRVTMPVSHDHREVEFHDLLDEVNDRLDRMAPNRDFGGASCETIARNLMHYFVAKYFRRVTVDVSEDDECGATVSGDPQICGFAETPAIPASPPPQDKPELPSG